MRRPTGKGNRRVDHTPVPSKVLPRTGKGGKTIEYEEHYVNPATPGGIDAERFVTGSDGSVWFTDDHYHSFKLILSGAQ